MSTVSWDDLQRLFDEAVELAPEARAAFLHRACPDPALRRQVEGLLQANDHAGDFLEVAIDQAADAYREATDVESFVGRRVGAYELVSPLGHGGMGAVYLGHRVDQQFDQRVAIKLIRPHVAGPEFRRRFHAERQILAQLDHPNIARLIDGGSTEDGLPYYVLEYVDGDPIDEYCTRNRLSIRAIVALFRDVCAAVQHAHRQLVVHRDLKPTNILVTRDGVPKLLDFGIAKLLATGVGDTGLAETGTGLRLMTPAYASPEQVRGEPVSVATDVYGLGAVLFELLTGRTVHRFADSTPSEIERVVCHEPPDRPSDAIIRGSDQGSGGADDGHTLRDPRARRRDVEGDLDTIVLMALRKEPERRYESATQLSEDLARYLEGRPVRAQPDTWRYRARKFVGRNRAGVVAATAFLLMLVAFAASMAVQAVRIGRERDVAAREREKAERVAEFLVNIFEVSDPGQSRGNTVTAREILDSAAIRVAEELGDQPEVRGQLQDAIGRVYRSLGLFDEAIPLVKSGLAARIEALGEDHPDVARSWGTLASLLYETGQFDSSIVLLERALEVFRRQPPGSGTEESYALTLNDLGWLRYEQGRYDDAATLHRQALAIRREIAGDTSEAVGESLNNLGVALYSLGRNDEAEPLLLQSLAVRRAALGDQHPEVATSLNNLAALYETLGEYDRADPMYREAIAISKHVLGDRHPALTTTLINFARNLMRAGRLDEADPVYQEAISIERETRGDNHPYVAYDLQQYAGYWMAREDPARAEQYAREAVAIYESIPGDPSPYLGPATGALADALCAQGKFDAAVGMYERSIPLWRTSEGQDNRQTFRMVGRLGACLTRAGRYEAAERNLTAAYEGLSGMYDPDHRYVVAVREALVRMFEAWNRPDAAARDRSNP